MPLGQKGCFGVVSIGLCPHGWFFQGYLVQRVEIIPSSFDVITLMFIGTAPASTGGGITTGTLVVSYDLP